MAAVCEFGKEFSMRDKNKFGFCLLLLLVCGVPGALLFSQSGASNKPAVFDHKTVHARDLQKSADFYEKVFGLERISDPFHDGRHIWFRIGPHEQLHVVGGATEVLPQPDIEVHFAFRVASFTEFIAHLDQMHVKYRSFKGDGKFTTRPDGVHQLYFQDPDQNWIEVNDDRF